MDRFVSREILDESKPNYGEVKKPESSVPYDPRPLYQRLAEKKRKEEDEELERNKLSNFIYQMNNDEYDFLNNVKEEENLKYKQLKEEEKKEVEKFRKDVESSLLKTPYLDSLLKETSKDNKTKDSEKKEKPKVQSFQKNLLQNIIVKKKRGRDNKDDKEDKEEADLKKVKKSPGKSVDKKETEKSKLENSALSLLANYSDSESESDSQSESN